MEQERNGNGHTYGQFMVLVDERIEAVTDMALGSDDLADGNSRDAWNDGETPESYANDLLADAGWLE